MILRPYRPADFKTLWDLDQLCFAPDIAYTEAELRLFLAHPGAFTIVAEAGKTIQGFILTHLHRKVGHIITIDVRSDQRRTGLGTRLLAAAEARLREENKEAVILEVAVDNLAALTFYKRHGFSVVRTIPRYYNNGLDALEMVKPLSPV